MVRNRSGGVEWHLSGIEDQLDKCRDMAPYPDLVHAATAAAREPLNRTPAIIGMDGPHWRRAEVPPSWKPADPWTLCHECSLSEVDCAKKQYGFPPADRHRFVSRGQVANEPVLKPKDAARAEAKAALAAAKATVCAHGARPGVPCRLCDVEGARPVVEAAEGVATP